MDTRDFLKWLRLEAALDFATKAHEGQVRKYTGEPYICHPIAVARLVVSVVARTAVSVADGRNMIIAAILHDTVEDTDVTLDEIERLFGVDVASLVESLTNVSTLQDGLRRMRKEVDRLHTAKASPRAKTIKLADLIDNSRSIIERDPKFAKVYIGEKKLLLEVLAEGDPALFSEAQRIVFEAHEKLGMCY
ncbi:HD domain-containing protein [Ferrovum sp.]|uniref:HD domain-containing protein n=1 Tax=Ferrovum sp. TaxID=2609467 RepID=UPI00260905C3|nr:HD domain-containing protein [Ferrovum sp.]